MRKFHKIFAFAILAVALFLSCNKNNPTAGKGSGTETGNAMVIGKLYYKNGNPAANATLHIRKKTVLADTTGAGLHKVLVDTAAAVTTNDTGGFTIDSINPGLYVIEGAKDSNVVLIDSVTVKSKDSTVVLPPDTLRPAGALKGIIYLSEGGDPRKVFILAFGIDRFAGVNLNGSFKFSNLAEGRYDLRIISSLDNYGVLDTFGISINSADTANLDTIRLPFTGIPTPKNVVIAYDTLRQIVTLTWAKADTALAKSYNVYRRNVGLNTILARINTSPVADTVYRDSTGAQDSTYEYVVAAVSPTNMEGTKSIVASVKIETAFKLLATLGNGTGTGDGYFSGLRAIAIDNSGNFYCVDESNNRIQKFDSSGNFLMKWGSTGSNDGQFSHPTDIAMDSMGNVYISEPTNNRIQKFDSNGIFIKKWGANLNEPYRIAINGGLIFVGEYSGKRLHTFDLDGNLIATYNMGSIVTGLAILDSSVLVSMDSTVLKYTNQGSLLGTAFTTSPIIGSSNRPGLRGLYSDGKSICFSTVVSFPQGEDAIFITDLSGNIICKYVLVNEAGTPQDLFIKDGILYVAMHDGYINKYAVR